MTDQLAAGQTSTSAKTIERSFKDAFRLSRLQSMGRGSDTEVHYVNTPGTAVHLHLRHPTARAGSAIRVELIVFDQSGTRLYEVNYLGKEGPPSGRASLKVAKRLTAEFTSSL